MNVKNEMPTGRISCIKGRPTLEPERVAAFVMFSEKNP